MKLGELVVEIGADTSQLKRSEQEVSKTTQRMEAGFSKVGSAIAAAFSAETARQVIMVADQMTRLEGTVRRLTRTTGDFDKTWSKLVDLSNENGAAIADTTALFQRFQMTMDKMVDSNDDVLNFVDTLQKVGRLGGSSAEEMSNALIQLSQGFAGGIIRAEEFNSVSEQMPYLLQIAADNIEGLDGDIGKLRQSMLDGQLTSDVFYKAISRGGKDIDKEFKKLPDTIDLASTKLRNNLAVAISELDKKIGASENIAEFISSMADLVDRLSSSGLEQGKAAKGVEEVGNAIMATDARIKSIKMSIKDLESATKGDSISDSVVRFMYGDDLDKELKQKRSELEKEIELRKELDAKMITELGKGVGINDASGIGGTKTPKSSDEKEPILGTGTDPIDDEIKKLELRAEIYEDTGARIDAEILRQRQSALKIYKEGSQEMQDIDAQLIENRVNMWDEYFSEQETELKKSNDKTAQDIANAYQSMNRQIGNALGSALASTQSWGDAMKSIIGNLASQFISAGLGSLFGQPAGGGNIFGGLFGGAGRAMGGQTSGMLAHPINERGVPEIYKSGGKQYLLPTGQNGEITPMQQGGGFDLGSISIVSTGTPQQIESRQMDNGQIQIMIGDAISKYNGKLMSDIKTGKGDFGKSFGQGYKATRNMGVN